MKGKISKAFLATAVVMSALNVSAKVDDLGIVGPKGEVLFYKDGNNIVMKQCRDYTVLKTPTDCILKDGTIEAKTSVENFKAAIKLTLELPSVQTELNSSLLTEVKVHNAINAKGLSDKLQNVIDFIGAFGIENADRDFLKKVQDLANDSTLDYKQIAAIVKKVNSKIDKIVTDISNAGLDASRIYKHSDRASNIVYNVLRSYTSTPLLPLESSLVTIKKGSFVMGSPSNESGRYSDECQTNVTISKDIAVMKTEVTQLQYFQVMGSNPSYFSKKEYCPESYTIINGVGLCPNNPVEQVSYNDIVNVFLPKLNAQTGKNFRLLTEAEWEYAARAGTTSAYSSGSADLRDYAWYYYNSKINGNYQTHKVATKLANPAGLFDMHGNVWEWVQDAYQACRFGGVDPLITAGPYRVVRGGSYGNGGARYLRSADRAIVRTVYRLDVGFRLVRDL